MIGWLIVICEIGFWVLVVAGLVARYLLGWKKIGAGLLISTPIVDLILIIATVVDLRSGTTAGAMHGLAAIYIGATVAFGKGMIGWADRHFAYRFAGGAKPEPQPKSGRAHAKREREGWYRHFLAWCIGTALLWAMVWLVGDAEQTKTLARMSGVWTMVLGIDFVISFSYTLWPKAEKKVSA